VAVAYGIAVALPVFSTLLGIFGAVTSTIIAYILPTFFYMRTSQRSFLKDRFSWVALALLILGGSAGLVGKIVSLVLFINLAVDSLRFSLYAANFFSQASFGFIVEGAAKNGLG
jgi:hypothetical protein